MRYAIMSDVHANPEALKTALADARKLGCGRFIFLGDLTGYGYDAKTTLALIRDNFDIVLMGNHDSACAGLELEWEVERISNYDVDRAQRKQLTDEEKGWIKNRQFLHVEKGVAFVHGDFTMPQTWNYIMTGEAAVQNFFTRPERLMFCGHTHHLAIWEATAKGEYKRKLKERFRKIIQKPSQASFKLKEGSRYIVNVGSVGHPRNDYCSSYGIYDSEEERVIIRRLPFDLKGYIDRMDQTKTRLPLWLEGVREILFS